MDASDNIMVSVRLMVYNNEPFIREALEGALMQKTNFKYEIVIGDDFSTDGTREILQDYSEQYPEVINLLERPVGGEYYKRRKARSHRENFLDILRNCKGKYTALLDGDDYWTDELKLQKQVDFLEGNKDYTIVAHNTYIRKRESINSRGAENRTYVLEDFIKETKVGGMTSSLLFRRSVKVSLAKTVFGENSGMDWVVCVLALKEGKMKFLSSSMGVRRIHEKGIYSSKNWLYRFRLVWATAKVVDEVTEYKYSNVILNFHVRKLFLGYLNRSNLVDKEEMIEEYKKMETSKIRLLISMLFIRSPFCRLYLRTLSKILFFKVNVA